MELLQEYTQLENLTDLGPAIFIAYSVDLLPDQIPKAASEIDEVKFVSEKDFDSLLWVSEAMKSIASNAINQIPFSTTDYSEQRGHPYLLHQHKEGFL